LVPLGFTRSNTTGLGCWLSDAPNCKNEQRDNPILSIHRGISRGTQVSAECAVRRSRTSIQRARCVWCTLCDRHHFSERLLGRIMESYGDADWHDFGSRFIACGRHSLCRGRAVVYLAAKFQNRRPEMSPARLWSPTAANRRQKGRPKPPDRP
jgi:hypothetical protein